MKWLLPLLFLATGCSYHAVTARTEYFDRSYLASSKINTPDVSRPCFNGQQLIINWKGLTHRLPATLVLTVRHGNYEVETFTHEISTPKGFWIYRLLDKEFWEKKGILSYSVKLYFEDQLVDTYNHHLWAEIIEIKE
ncbi:MAG: hypothetical protein S4CHLAM45_03010 [Chlamydiales bacterium]|nr:hypothetical protein [Chlamydiales bacterium]MCH9619159.1 hypothetical protein [Chlamydiales bacterium]MCH9622421.1 hypothetical protein [Chlamydiales bacterium]